MNPVRLHLVCHRSTVLNSTPRFGVATTSRRLRVASCAPPSGRAQWDPRVPSAARRAAFGRVGDGARTSGGAHDDRTRSRYANRVQSLRIVGRYLAADGRAPGLLERGAEAETQLR